MLRIPVESINECLLRKSSINLKYFKVRGPHEDPGREERNSRCDSMDLPHNFANRYIILRMLNFFGSLFMSAQGDSAQPTLKLQDRIVSRSEHCSTIIVV
jgi:hypothetical protein